MMEFGDLVKKMKQNFQELTADVHYLYETAADPDDVWNLYLDSFPPGTNEIFRNRREFDCGCCKQFIRQFGNVVVIKNGKVSTIWGFDCGDEVYQTVLNALDEFVGGLLISNVHVIRKGYPFQYKFTETSHERLESGEILTWNHFALDIPDKFINSSSVSGGELENNYRTAKQVFKRSLDEITEDAVTDVLDLISNKQLDRGEEWKSILEEFLKHKEAYSAAESDYMKDIYAWEKSVYLPGSMTRLRNTSMGTLLVDLSKGVDIDDACNNYEKIVDPTVYKHPKMFYTAKMLEDLENVIKENDLENSLDRRFAVASDLSINNVIFFNKDATKSSSKATSGNIFDKMKKDIPLNTKRFDHVEEVDVDEFIMDIAPTANSIEVLFENKHRSNLTSLIAPVNKDSKTLFKWNNNFSWAYSGNITDSSMRENVKMAGGNVDGVLRFSIQWNDGELNLNDLDAHCIEPMYNPIPHMPLINGSQNHIYFKSKGKKHPSSGMLDVDIIHPDPGVPAVENISWTSMSAMPAGTYQLFVHCYNQTYSTMQRGFKAEIEFNGEVHEFEYDEYVEQNEIIHIADVEYNKEAGTFTMIEKLKSNGTTSKEVWGVKTNTFIPASLVMLSPNYWDGQHEVGKKHYMFMLDKCINPEQPSGFYNEYLKEEFMKYKRAFASLGNRMRVQASDNQLSGLGFSSARRTQLIVRINGESGRVLKINF